MPSLAANISFLFTERPFLQRYEHAAAAGFAGVECLFPYAVPAGEIAQAIKESGLKQCLINAPAGEWDAGERGIAALPHRRRAFREGMLLALEYASAAGCGLIHCMAGLASPDVEPEAAEHCYRDNLEWAAREASAAGIGVTIEPISMQAMNGYYLRTVEQALETIAAIGAPNLGLQLDLYHLHLTEGSVMQPLERWLPFARHIQIADSPGRHEPGTGTLPWKDIFTFLKASKYEGWVGCEYNPLHSTESGFKWRHIYDIA